jgi:hypothetical protein
MPVLERRIEQIADSYAHDFFTRAPKYRSREYLRRDIIDAIKAALVEKAKEEM